MGLRVLRAIAPSLEVLSCYLPRDSHVTADPGVS